MPTKIKNKTHLPLDIWLSMGAPQRWDNNVPNEGVAVYKPGYVWFTLNAKVHSGEENEVGAGQLLVDIGLGGAAAVAPYLAPWLLSIAAAQGVADTVTPGANLHFKPGVNIKHAEATGVYGGWDMNYEVHGGEPHRDNPNDPNEITSVDPLRFEAVSEADASGW